MVKFNSFNNFGSNNVDNSEYLYARSLAAYPALKKANVDMLCQQIAEGGEAAIDARNKLVEHNLRLVVKIVGKMCLNHEDLRSDLIEEGNLALIKAAEKYNPYSGTSFATYASTAIRNAVRDAMLQFGYAVSLPHDAYSLLNKDTQAPGSRRKDEILNATRHSVRLDTPLYKDEDDCDVTLADRLEGDMIRPDESFGASLEDFRQMLRGALTFREYEIVTRVYGIGCPLESKQSIAADLGLSPERVRQIGKLAIKKLRHSCINDDAMRYLISA